MPPDRSFRQERSPERPSCGPWRSSTTWRDAPRGIYGGGIGYFSIDGSSDFAIAIRSVLVKDGVATVQAGAGIVADSDPEKEYQETERKMAAMKRALGVAV